MPSPYPGMDPYLERPSLWPGVHNSIAGDLYTQLNAVLPNQYVAILEASDVVLQVEDGFRGRQRTVPDIGIIQQTTASASELGVAVAEPPSRESVYDTIPNEVVVSLAQVTVYDLTQPSAPDALGTDEERFVDGVPVTSIEILSPTNKRSRGPDRDAYERKRQSVLASGRGLVEIDLLRTGTGYVSQPDPLRPYSVCVHFPSQSQPGRCYRAGLADPLPTFAVPLLPVDGFVLADLQQAIRTTYDRGPFGKLIDYTQPPVPPLDESLASSVDPAT